jgi:hypothetical protein
LYYVLCIAGFPLALWIGDLAAAENYLAQMISRAAGDRWRRCWALILRLRQGDERDALIAAFHEPRYIQFFGDIGAGLGAGNSNAVARR